MVVEIEDEKYQQDVKALIFSVVGKLSLQKGDPPPTTMELREKHRSIWKVVQFELIPLGIGDIMLSLII